MNMSEHSNYYGTKEHYSFTGAYLSKKIGKHHRALTRFIFQSKCKKTNSNIVNQIAGATWANQFKYLYSPLAPPTKRYGNVSNENRWAIIYPPP